MSVQGGHYVGGWYRWSCEICGCVLEAKAPPGEDRRRCGGCEALAAIGDSKRAIEAVMVERDLWQARALRAERELDKACDAIAQINENAKGATA